MQIIDFSRNNNHMGNDISQLNLADKDLYLSHIEKEIEEKRKMLLKKQKMLKNSTKRNHFLEDVQKDYKLYYDYIIRQKQEQINAMNILNKYIDDLVVSGKLSNNNMKDAKKDDLVVSGKLSNNNMKDAKKEEQKILNEIHKMKRTLDEIVRETSYRAVNDLTNRNKAYIKEMQITEGTNEPKIIKYNDNKYHDNSHIKY